MNWYYQKRVGLDMLFFWEGGTCRCCSPGLPSPSPASLARAAPAVNGWPAFLEWGAVYSALFAIALWLAVLTKDERIAVVSRLPFLR